MLEQDIRDTYRRMAAVEMPPSAISIPAAGRDGRTRQRRRRTSLIAAPAFAAAAVLAIALVTVISPGLTSRPDVRPTSGRVEPGYFNPLVPFASFGWLPPGWQVRGDEGANTVELEAASPSGTDMVSWTAFAPGRCQRAGSKLTCGIAVFRLTGVAPSVRGHRAYWGTPRPDPDPPAMVLAYQFVPGGWAILGSYQRQGQSETLRIARAVRTGLTKPLRFAVRLTGERNGQVVAAAFLPTPSGPLGTWLVLQFRWGTLEVYAEPPHLNWGLPPCSPNSEFIPYAPAGHKPARHHQDLCAQRDGMIVVVVIGSNLKTASTTPGRVLARHLKVLGSDPANWTTKPVG